MSDDENENGESGQGYLGHLAKFIREMEPDERVGNGKLFLIFNFCFFDYDFY